MFRFGYIVFGLVFDLRKMFRFGYLILFCGSGVRMRRRGKMDEEGYGRGCKEGI